MDTSSTKNGMSLLFVVAWALTALLLALALPQHALAGTVEIEATGAAHTYDAFKIFACDVEGDDEVSNVSIAGCMPDAFYKDAFKSSKPQDMAEEASAALNGSDASSYAVKLSKIAALYASQASSTSITTGEKTELQQGVYLLVSHDAQPVIVTVGAGAVKISEKSTVPSVEKTVAVGAATWAQTAAAGTSQKITFRVEGTLPSNYAVFDTYSYAFVDEPCEALSIDLSTVSVTLVAADGSESQVESGSYTATWANGVLKVAFADLKAALPSAAYGCKIALSYEAALDPAKAAFGFASGNANKVHVEYRRSPSYEETGSSPEVSTKVYTFKLSITKVGAESDGKALAGASFRLESADGVEIASGTTGSDGMLVLASFGPGTYKLYETAAPDGYAKLDKPVTIEISTDTESQKLTATASSSAAQITAVDAQAGTVGLRVTDNPTDETSGANTDTGTNSKTDTSAGSLLKTGDVLCGMLVGLVVLAAVALIALVVSRRKSGEGE